MGAHQQLGFRGMSETQPVGGDGGVTISRPVFESSMSSFAMYRGMNVCQASKHASRFPVSVRKMEQEALPNAKEPGHDYLAPRKASLGRTGWRFARLFDRFHCKCPRQVRSGLVHWYLVQCMTWPTRGNKNKDNAIYSLYRRQQPLFNFKLSVIIFYVFILLVTHNFFLLASESLKLTTVRRLRSSTTNGLGGGEAYPILGRILEHLMALAYEPLARGT